MNDRKTASTITDDDLTHLYDQLTALRAVARGYCPACGRGDCAPTVADWEQQKQRADQAEELLNIAHDTSNKSEAARADAVQRAEHAEEMSQRLLRQRQEMAAERYAWQERGDRAEGAMTRVRALHTRVLRMDALVCAHCGHVWPCRTIRALDQAATQATDVPELTADEARNLVDELSTDLYRAQDTLAYVSEWCDLADRDRRPITTSDVREWLKGDRCARQRAADAAPCRCHQEQP